MYKPDIGSPGEINSDKRFLCCVVTQSRGSSQVCCYPREEGETYSGGQDKLGTVLVAFGTHRAERSGEGAEEHGEKRRRGSIDPASVLGSKRDRGDGAGRRLGIFRRSAVWFDRGCVGFSENGCKCVCVRQTGSCGMLGFEPRSSGRPVSTLSHVS